MPTLHCVIHGRVQGVGFRYFAQRCAEELGLNGWVRNLRGGLVETEVEGSREVLERYLSEMQSGPAHATVSRVDAEWFDIQGAYSSFEIRATEW